MLVIFFERSDLARLRFAISPLVELQRSVRALDDPGAQALHLPWIVAMRAELADLNLDLLRALGPSRVYTPDFIHPPPTTPLAELEDELGVMIATPPDHVRREIRRAYQCTGVPQILQPFLDDPPAAVVGLAALLREYWRRALAPHWDRLRSLLEGDILYRARRLADSGAQGLFADIHPELSFDDGELRIEKPFEVTVALEGRGVLWDPEQRPQPEALHALLGERRASVLEALDVPRSTTELARRLGVSPGSVSQHLRVLRAATLVDGHRVGRNVLYVRSPTGNKLAELGQPSQPRGRKPDEPLLPATRRRTSVMSGVPPRKRTRRDGRCPARTGDLLGVRREQLLRSAAVCRSSSSLGAAKGERVSRIVIALARPERAPRYGVLAPST